MGSQQTGTAAKGQPGAGLLARRGAVAVGAAVVYAALTRLVAGADRWFTAVAAVVLLASLVPDFTYIPNEPGGTMLGGAVLATMHVTAAAVAVAALTGQRPDTE